MAGVVVTMSGDEARLVRAMQKVLEQQDKLNKKAGEGGNISSNASSKAVAGIDKWSASATGAAAALGVLSAAQAQLASEQNKGVESVNRLIEANKRLLQISDSPQTFKASQSISDAAAVKFAVDREVARDVYFQADSGGFQGARDFILEASVVIDPETASMIAAKFPALFKGVDPETAIKLTGFSAKSSPLNFEQMAAVAPTVAQGMGLLSASMEESLAAQSVLATRFKGNGEQVADALNSFTTSLGIDERFAGKGFLNAFQTLQGLPEAERKDFLGKSQELNRAYMIISDEIGNIVAATKANADELQRIEAGGGLLVSQIATAKADPLIAASRLAISAANRAEIANEKLSAASGFKANAAGSFAEESMLVNANLLQRTVDSGLRDFVSEIPFVGGMLSSFIPDSTSRHIAGSLSNFGIDPETAGQIGAGVSMAHSDPGGFLGLMQMMVTSQIKSSQVMADAATKMAESVERSSINSKTNGARGMAEAVGR